MPDVIDAGDLVLVRWNPADVDDLLSAVRASLDELRQWMHWAQVMPTREEQLQALTEGEASFEAGTDFGYLFRESVSGDVVGGGGAHRRLGPAAIEIGYWVRTDRHGRGYATTAAEAITNSVFEHLDDVDRIEIHMDCANTASARIPDKLGYQLVGTEQREKLAAGHTGEGLTWELTRAGWSTAARSQQ